MDTVYYIILLIISFIIFNLFYIMYIHHNEMKNIYNRNSNVSIPKIVYKSIDRINDNFFMFNEEMLRF